MRKIGMRWTFKTIIKLIVSVFVVSTFIVHYQSQKLDKTGSILKGVGNRNGNDNVVPFKDTFLINSVWWKEFNDEGAEHPYLVIIVTSSPEGYERRNLIRNTWMRYDTPKNVLVLFFLGRSKGQDKTKLDQESETYRDLILDDFQESYYSLTVKTLRILKWFTMNVPRSKFLVKTDDDVFINTPKLIEYLTNHVEHKEQKERQEHYMGGVVFKNRSPHTLNPFSKWYVPPKLWKDEVQALSKLVPGKDLGGVYPPYLEGNFYVISGNSVPLVLNSSLVLPLYHLEDVFITGFVGSALLSIELQTIPGVYSDSAIFPNLNYEWNLLFTNPKDVVAYHCDKEVNIIKKLYDQTKTY